MRLINCLPLALLLAACASTAEQAEPASTSSPAPTSLVDLLEEYAASSQQNITFDSETHEWLASIPVERVGADDLNLLRVGPAPSSPADGVEVIVLEHAEAGEMADLLHDFLLDATRGGVNELSIVSDERLNSLLISGPRERLAEVKHLIVQLDVAPAEQPPQ